MKLKKNKKILLIIFSMLLIAITSFCIAINKKGNVFYNLVHKQEKLADDEIELDNWEISTVFYDSTVNNGNTPLTEINWDASDGGYGQGETRVITVQVTYRNTNTIKKYSPGDLKIQIPNLVYNRENNSNLYQISTDIKVGANDSTHSNYDWTFSYLETSYPSYNYPHYRQKDFVFRNAIEFSEKSNYEGTIQIEYTITPKICVGEDDYDEPKFQDTSVHAFDMDLTAVLNDTINSNTIHFSYTRTYIHPWEKAKAKVRKSSTKITSYDSLADNPKDYYWVTYKLNISRPIPQQTWHEYPKLAPNQYYYLDELPKECIVLNKNLTEPDIYEVKENTIVYKFETYWAGDEATLIVGYPKSKYNSENNNTHQINKVELYGDYEEWEQFVYQDSASIEIDVQDYEFEYTGEKYSIRKINQYGTGIQPPIYYQTITGENTAIGKNNQYFHLNPKVIYDGDEMDVKFGDDMLYVSTEENGYRKLKDSEYYFSEIDFPNLVNGNDKSINGKYEVELWVRYRDTNNYSLYKNFMSTAQTFHISSSDKIVGYYFVIKSLKESIKVNSSWYGNFSNELAHCSRIYFTNVEKDIAKTGPIFNYSFMQVYVNGVEQIQIDDSQYNEFAAPEEMAEYDLEEYGKYPLRSFSRMGYSYFNIDIIYHEVGITKTMEKFIQDVEQEKFLGTAKISLINQSSGAYGSNEIEAGFSGIDDVYFIRGYEVYDLLPLGMKLESSSEDIINSINNGFGLPSNFYYSKDGKEIKPKDFVNVAKESATVNIINNWNNTGRTKISVVFEFDSPILIFNILAGGYPFLGFSYDYSVSYDMYSEFGKVWENTAYVKFHNQPYNKYIKLYNPVKDELDLNDNGNTLEDMSISKSSANISSIISTHQDIQITVKSSDNYYETDGVKTNNDEEYTYKLRARTGSNDVTNLIIYDSIEDYAKDSNLSFINANGTKGHWQGEFLGVDTSYAESKGYQVKVYYNENPQPGSLKEDNTWQEYNDSVDKTKVKSLAFEYLDEHGDPTIIPANSLTYVLVKMKSPSEEFKTFAYNGCWTEWNAIDSITNQPVDFITGINSNIVRVALPSSIEPEDMELSLTKKWIDNSNSLNKRPENVTFRIIPNDDYSKSTEVTFSGTGNTWEYTTTVPKYDDDGEEIEYTIKEDTINLEENYKYVPSVDNNKVTNTLYKNIVITKNWLDNNNSYLTRPPNITVKVYQNGNYYKDLNITGNYSTNTWTGSLSVPVFDNSGNEYTYTVDEISVDGYSTTCENLVCTNLLNGTDSITITKEWIDNDNTHNTRPSSINIKLKQNGEDYQTISLTGDTNTWVSDEITVPKYDSNGVKYTYTIIEDTIPKYGLIEYDQEHYKVTNTLKEMTLLTITKIWKDNDNEYQTRPSSLQITLLQNDNDYKTVTLTGDGNTWTTTIEVPKYDDNQEEYTYSIKEVTDNLDDYQDITYNENDLTVTNGLKKDYDLTITKKWIDHDNDYQTRPGSIKVKLLQNGEEYQTLEMSGDTNNWTKTITVPYYDSNYKKYEYTIVEDLEISKYGNITYDQTTHTITNELTDIPKVTVYFTVLNGYIDPITNEMKYDEEGFREMIKRHNIDPDSDYEFTFELQNIETNEIYEGKLSTKGVLEFEDIPYGDYRALEGKDDIFEFVSMESISEVLGVKFTPGKNGGIISIRPTGQDIIYGANIINKITAPIKNPNTGTSKIIFIAFLLMILSLIVLIVIKKYPKLIKGHVN